MLGLFQQPQQLFDPRMMLADPLWDTRADLSMPDVTESDDVYQVIVAAPGVKPEDIKVTLDRGILRIKGESAGEHKHHSFRYTVDKTVKLPEGLIDADGVEACNEHGMLCICVPKRQELQGSQPRTIKVKAGSKGAKRIK